MSGAGYRLYEKEREALLKAKPMRFRTDARMLRQWLDRRKSSLEEVRKRHEPLWRELREYFEPNMGKALLDAKDRDAEDARREDGKILNSEPRIAVERYAAGMQSGITNKAQAWCAIVPKLLDEEDARDPELNTWCNAATSEILSALERANFYRTTQNVYPHAAVFGTSCVMVLHGDEPGDVFFHLVDEGDYWLAEDRYGRVTTLMRRMNMTLGQAKEEFLVGNLPEGWRMKISDGRLEERVEVWNLICANDGTAKFRDVGKGRPWGSFYWTEDVGAGAEDGCGIIDISSFEYRPFAVLRQKNGGGVYGKGLGEISLPDNKELQTLEEYLLRMIANEAEPAMLAPASMKGKPINMFPGGVTFYDGLAPAGVAPVTRLFQTQEGIDKVDAKIRGVEDRIRRMWYNDLFAMMLNITQGNRAQKTATEVSELAGEKVTLLGPVLTQMDEFLDAVIDAVFAMLLSDGVLPEPPEALASGYADVAVEYTSTIHAEMKAALKMRSINTLLEMAAMLAQMKPDATDKIDIDRIIDETSRIYPGAAAFIKADKEVAAIREARDRRQQEALANQQMMELAKTAGANAKALSEARVGNGNALDLVTEGLA